MNNSYFKVGASYNFRYSNNNLLCPALTKVINHCDYRLMVSWILMRFEVEKEISPVFESLRPLSKAVKRCLCVLWDLWHSLKLMLSQFSQLGVLCVLGSGPKAKGYGEQTGGAGQGASCYVCQLPWAGEKKNGQAEGILKSRDQSEKVWFKKHVRRNYQTVFPIWLLFCIPARRIFVKVVKIKF